MPAAEAVHAPRTARVPIPLGMVNGPSADAPGLAATVASRRRHAARRGRLWQGLLAALVVGALAGAAYLVLHPLSEEGGGNRSTDSAQAVQPPWLRELAPAQRDAARSAALAQDGDNLYLAGDRGLARTKYLEAFEANPTPALALKLGMLAHLRGAAGEAEARGFFARALRDAPATPALGPVKAWYPDLEPAAPPPRSAGRAP